MVNVDPWNTKLTGVVSLTELCTASLTSKEAADKVKELVNTYWKLWSEVVNEFSSFSNTDKEVSEDGAGGGLEDMEKADVRKWNVSHEDKLTNENTDKMLKSGEDKGSNNKNTVVKGSKMNLKFICMLMDGTSSRFLV